MSTLATIVSLLIGIYQFLIFIRVLLSWINVDPYRPRIDHPIVDLLIAITDPILKPFRRAIPPIGGAVDISPIVVLFGLEIIRRVVYSVLSGL